MGFKMIILTQNAKTNNSKLLAAKFPTKERCEFACNLINDEKNFYRPALIDKKWRIEAIKTITCLTVDQACNIAAKLNTEIDNTWKYTVEILAGDKGYIKVFDEESNFVGYLNKTGHKSGNIYWRNK